MLRMATLLGCLAAIACRSRFDATHPDGSGTAPGDAGGSDAIDAPPPDAGTCSMAAVTCADGGTLRTCAVAGGQAVDTPCAWGCLDAPSAHCGVLVPSGGGVLATDVSSTGLSGSIQISGTINGDDGSIAGV